MSKRTRRLLIAAVWACAAAVGVLMWFVPALGSAIGRAAWPAGVFTGAVFGWRERGRAGNGPVPLFDRLLLLVLAAFAGDLVIPGPWSAIPTVALLGVSLWLVRRARRG